MTIQAIPSRKREVTRAAIVLTIEILIVAAIGLLASHMFTIDHFDGVYGLSFGTNNKYCYVDLDQWHAIVWGCESAR